MLDQVKAVISALDSSLLRSFPGRSKSWRRAHYIVTLRIPKFFSTKILFSSKKPSFKKIILIFCSFKLPTKAMIDWHVTVSQCYSTHKKCEGLVSLCSFTEGKEFLLGFC